MNSHRDQYTEPSAYKVGDTVRALEPSFNSRIWGWIGIVEQIDDSNMGRGRYMVRFQQSHGTSDYAYCDSDQIELYIPSVSTHSTWAER